jgi:predicted N-acyltransferase
VEREGRVITSLCDEAARPLLRDWSLLDRGQQPFLALEFLAALEESGAVHADSGWQAHHLALFEADELVAFAPTYLKFHSHGEFVFDFAWADAYQRHGLAYYPKLLTAVPYSPITGARLLVRQDHPHPEQLRAELIGLALQQCRQLQLSSWHCNFAAHEDLPSLQLSAAIDTDQEGLLPRFDWQFHWQNQGFAGFGDFLATLRSKKRKNLLRDRRLVREAGIQFRRLKGHELSEPELDFVYACYQNTFLQHGNHPALTRGFFGLLVQRMPEAVLVVLAERAAKRDREPIAMAFFLQGGGRLYGRYWGCVEEVPGLHFETAYHQGIEHCIAEGLAVFEPGAQGEHKISRGFSPVKTHSFHYICDARFSNAIGRYLQQEAEWMADYRVRLEELLPFRHAELAP